MKDVTPLDASLLALVTEHPRMPDEQFSRILTKMTDLDIRLMAQAIREMCTGKPYSHQYTSKQLAEAEFHCQCAVRNRQRAAELRARRRR